VSGGRSSHRRKIERRTPVQGVTIRHDDPHVPKRIRLGRGKTPQALFLHGAAWAYQELTGALIVPASFEEAARAAAEES
jgi:hypothetical protein